MKIIRRVNLEEDQKRKYKWLSDKGLNFHIKNDIKDYIQDKFKKPIEHRQFGKVNGLEAQAASHTTEFDNNKYENIFIMLVSGRRVPARTKFYLKRKNKIYCERTGETLHFIDYGSRRNVEWVT